MKKFEKTVMIKGKETTVTIQNLVTDEKWVGVAKCNPMDKNDINTGIEIAFTRAKMSINSDKIFNLKEEIKQLNDIIKTCQKEIKKHNKQIENASSLQFDLENELSKLTD